MTRLRVFKGDRPCLNPEPRRSVRSKSVSWCGKKTRGRWCCRCLQGEAESCSSYAEMWARGRVSSGLFHRQIGRVPGCNLSRRQVDFGPIITEHRTQKFPRFGRSIPYSTTAKYVPSARKFVVAKLFAGREIVDRPQPTTPLSPHQKREPPVMIPPTNTELLRHVRSLFYISYHPGECEPSPISSTATPLRQLPRTVRDVQSLSSLALSVVSLQWRSFIAIIDYFPNPRNLELQCLSFEDENRNLPPLSRPLRGTLSFYPSEEKSLAAFFDWFTRLEVEYEELVVDLGDVSAACSQRITDTCGKALKRLELETCECVVPWIMSQTLADPTLKCQVPLQVSLTVQSFVNCGSLRCTRHGGTKTSSLPLHIQTAGWSSFDNCISALADRLCKSGNRRTRIGTPPRVSMTPDPTVGDMEFLPKFEEKGRVRIVN